jgi:hypothetical protein
MSENTPPTRKSTTEGRQSRKPLKDFSLLGTRDPSQSPDWSPELGTRRMRNPKRLVASAGWEDFFPPDDSTPMGSPSELEDTFPTSTDPIGDAEPSTPLFSFGNGTESPAASNGDEHGGFKSPFASITVLTASHDNTVPPAPPFAFGTTPAPPVTSNVGDPGGFKNPFASIAARTAPHNNALSGSSFAETVRASPRRSNNVDSAAKLAGHNSLLGLSNSASVDTDPVVAHPFGPVTETVFGFPKGTPFVGILFEPYSSFLTYPVVFGMSSNAHPLCNSPSFFSANISRDIFGRRKGEVTSGL